MGCDGLACGGGGGDGGGRKAGGGFRGGGAGTIQRIPQKAPALSPKADKCKPLPNGRDVPDGTCHEYLRVLQADMAALEAGTDGCCSPRH